MLAPVRLLLTALLAALLLAAPARADDTAVDIEIAIDTTGSMTPSIENAQRDARTIVARTQQTLPNARFAIVQFRDVGDTPEYEVSQPLTADGAAVAAAIAAATNVRDPSEDRLADGLAARLAGHTGLLVLDNCDRVLGVCAALVTRMLERCPGLRVIATSREWLGAAGEQTLRLAPLGVPDADAPASRAAVSQSDAVRLFVACAGTASGGFRLTDR